ncbi:family 20 glycosylhydrolase [Kitasatospora sp. NPDC004614]|uniref:family 20 glycosylhydrolase n=1 Tax=unclassified Kitasatospora TaxID=2633591 RepID=UPI003680C71E
MPEIDMPGHSTAAILAHPDRCSAVPTAVPSTPQELMAKLMAGEFRPVWLEPGREQVWQFVDDVLAELAALTPGRFVHIGGDEPFGMPTADRREFVTRVRERVRAHGKEPIGWQETVRTPSAPGEVVQLWIDEELAPDPDAPFMAMLPPQLAEMILASAGDAAGGTELMAEQRAGVILSPSGRTHLDRPYAETVEGEDEERRSRLGHRGYPPATVELSCTGPIVGIDTEAGFEAAGFEAAIWCESVNDADDLSFLLLPRLPGLAERAWTAGPARSWDDLRVRLGAQAPGWRRDGYVWFPDPSVDWR